jgi:uncharacterized membrane protein YeaQ/YmgE (transglycosylase-associated protein family)
MSVDPTFIAIWVVIGIVIGVLVSIILKAASLGVIGDGIVGLVGAVIAGYALPRLGVYFGAGFVPEVVNAVIGAVVLLLFARLVKSLMPKNA